MDFDQIQATQESLWNAATKTIASSSPEKLRREWDESFERASPQHRLTLLYFANEVCQRCRKTHPEFLGQRCFASILPSAFGKLARQKPEYADKLARIINVWEERSVMTVEDIDSIRSAMTGYPEKRQRVSTNDEYSGGGPAASPSLLSDSGDALLSLDPVVATLARANSNGSLHSDPAGRTGPSPFTPATLLAEQENYMMEVVMLAKNLDYPKLHEELFRKIDQGESDSVKFELDQENQDRLALKVYKLLKSKLASGSSTAPQLAEIAKELKSLTVAMRLEEQEQQAEMQRTNPDMYEVAETTENIHIEVRPSLESIKHREKELEMQLERDQEVLVGLSDILQQVQEQTTQSRQSNEEEATKTELEKLDDKIARCEEVTRRLRNEIDRQQDQHQRELEAAAKAQAQAQALEKKAARRPRWGEPTVPTPSILTSAPHAQMETAASGMWPVQQQVYPQSQWLPSPLPPFEQPQSFPTQLGQHFQQQHWAPQYPPDPSHAPLQQNLYPQQYQENANQHQHQQPRYDDRRY